MTKYLPDDIVPPAGPAGHPDEVASFVVFLAGDESSFATGSEFVVDGGLITDVPAPPDVTGWFTRQPAAPASRGRRPSQPARNVG